MNNEDLRIETMLRHYRPKGAPAELRERIFTAPVAGPSRFKVAWWLAVAAMLMASIGLQFANSQLNEQICTLLQPGRTIWTAEVEELAQMMNGNGWGRRYLALHLAAGSIRGTTAQMNTNQISMSGEI
ncbi:MAG: hypothetical protein KAT56_05865 [Sedimentisphaerales bacterium]|nr:hypothetical protein [Sedimentisphaerales bacterium]